MNQILAKLTKNIAIKGNSHICQNIWKIDCTFTFHPDLLLIADPSLLSRYDELAFSAGTLERSIILNTQDYASIVQPTLVDVIKTE